MLLDAKRPSGIPVGMWEVIGPSSHGENEINNIAATSDHKWLFATCQKGWWGVLDLQKDKCVSRQHCLFFEDKYYPSPTSVAVSPDDKLFYIVTNCGTVASYDIQAAKAGEKKSIPNQFLVKIAVDPENKFVFIASADGNLYKYDTG